jgi:hypothetical protein
MLPNSLKQQTIASEWFVMYFSITNFMGHDLAIIVMQILFFISLYGIDMHVIHLLVMLEH